MNTDGTVDSAHTGTIVFDLDGVVYLGDSGISGARESLAAVSDLGWHIVFATNNSTRSADAVLDHIEDRTGFRGSDVDVVTSAMAAAAWTVRDHRSVFVVGEQGLRDTLSDAGLEIVGDDADAVVVGLDRTLDYDTIAKAARLVRNGATYIATNTDATFPTSEGPVPGAGTVVAAISKAGGRNPIVCGKPEDPMVEMVRTRLRGAPVWVVGDRLETDIAMANRSGWVSVLVLTGVSDSGDHIGTEYAPDFTIDSIASLPALIASQHHSRRHNER